METGAASQKSRWRPLMGAQGSVRESKTFGEFVGKQDSASTRGMDDCIHRGQHRVFGTVRGLGLGLIGQTVAMSHHPPCGGIVRDLDQSPKHPQGCCADGQQQAVRVPSPTVEQRAKASGA